MTSTTIYYIVYKTTNNVNGKIYIGVHKTTNLNDSYLGSGTAIKSAIKLYGASNFSREVISIHSSYQSALDHEKEIVNEDFLKRSDVYNLTIGGGMPPDSTGRIIENTSNYSKANHIRWSDPEYKARCSSSMKGSRVMSEEQKLYLSNLKRNVSTKPHNEETKTKISIAQQPIYTFRKEDETFVGTLLEFSKFLKTTKQSIISSLSKNGKYKNWIRE